MISPGVPVPTSSITVNREQRQRRELTDIESLAASIAKRGLLHPIVVTRDLELVAGERRLTAIKSLGWTAVEVRYADTLDPSELHMIELEENLRRVDISWQEQCDALARWHELKCVEEPGWTKAATAEELGLSTQTVSSQLSLAEAVKKDERLAGVEKMSTALNVVRRQAERARSSVLAEIEGKSEVARTVPLLHTDFNEWASAYDGVKFNLLHCDFPYGIDANKQKQGTNIVQHGGYADGKDIYFALLDTLATSMPTLVAESAHLIFWFSMDYYEVTRQRLGDMGWRVNPFPLIWYKSDNTGLLPDPQRGPRRIYETAFFAVRGERFVVQPVSNCFAHPGRDKEIHMSEKPEAMLQHFFRMVVDENTVMLDPTAGSANALKVAERMGANHVLGLEKEEEFFLRSRDAYYRDDDLTEVFKGELA